MKISLFVHDLAANPIVRAYPIARALEKSGHEIEVLGFVLGERDVYKPYKDMFEYKILKVDGHIHSVLSGAFKLAREATGDMIYAFKPLWTSYWPALLASGFGCQKPLFLDVEDDELWFCYDGLAKFFTRHILRDWRGTGALKYKLLLHPLTALAHGKTVVSRKLNRRYGGEILLHGPDDVVFNTGRDELEPHRCRQKLGLPQDAMLVLFAGIPHPHKGLQVIVEALQNPITEPCHLVLAGPPDHPEFQSALVNLGDRCHVLGHLPYQRMPELLAAVDIVPVPQQHNGYTESQIPAKLLEAMAMEKLVIASNVSDLPEILGENHPQPRGWIIHPNDAQALAGVLAQIISNPSEAKCRGIVARQYYLQNASTASINRKLDALIRSTIRISPCQ